MRAPGVERILACALSLVFVPLSFFVPHAPTRFCRSVLQVSWQRPTTLSVLKIHWQNWCGGSSRRRCGHGLGGYIFLRTIGRPMQHMVQRTLSHSDECTSTRTSHGAADITYHLTKTL